MGGRGLAPAKKSRHPAAARLRAADDDAPRQTPRDEAGGARRPARAREGVTVAEAAAALGWQPHTVRGAFAGALKKRLGLTVTSEKVEGKERVYRLG